MAIGQRVQESGYGMSEIQCRVYLEGTVVKGRARLQAHCSTHVADVVKSGLDLTRTW